MHWIKVARASLTMAVLACLTLGSPAFSLFGNAALAQSTNGRLVITVKDEGGAAIAGAEITVVNQETQQEFTGTSSDIGIYALAQLPVGVYTITTKAPNFQTKVTQDVKIDVGQEYGLVVELGIGGLGETVTVVAGEDLVPTTNAELTTTVTEKQIKDLPLDGRNPLQLIQLQAGVANFNGNAVTHINGQRTSSTNITQDGINIQDNFIRSNATDFSPNRTSVAQVAEFSVTTQNAGAEAQGAASIRLVTPSGGNDFHGEVFEYHRNDALGANDFFNNAAEPAIERPKLIRNQFGFTFSGPVWIPKVYNGRDKFFFFGFYEGFRERAEDAFTTTVLTAPARQGIFTYTDNTGRTRTINVLQASGLGADPYIANAILGRVPTTINSDEVGDGLNTGGFKFNKSDPQDRNQGGGRLDYIFNDNHRLEAIYNYTGETDARNDIDTTFNISPIAGTRSTVHFAVAAWNWNISPTLINELRVGVNNSTVDFFSNEDQSAGFFLGLPLITDPVVTFEPQGRRTITGSIIDSASYSWGAHFFRGGFQADRIRVRSNSAFLRNPVVTLGFSTAASTDLVAGDFPGGISSNQLNTANALLALLGGVIDSATRNFEVTSQDSGFVPGAANIRNYEINQFSWYVSDQWRIHPRVTLNLGIRYDYISPLRERDNLALLPVLTGDPVATVLDPNGTFDFVNGYYWNPDRNNFAPNISVAWDVFGDAKTVVRGGYSQAYINDEAIRAADNAASGNDGLSQQIDTGDIYGTVSADIGTVTGGLLAAPEFRVPRSYLDNFNLDPASAAFAIDPNFQTPKYHQWNLSVEREVGWDTAVALRYVGNRGVDLARGIDYNQLDVIGTGFAEDVARARNNGFLSLAATGRFDPRFNANIPGSQQLTVFPLLAGGGLLTNGTIQSFIRTGEAGTLAQIYYTNGLAGSVQFTANPNIFVADVLGNGATSDYHAFQAEVRRRLSKGLAFQANYTFSKALTDSSGTTQQKFDPYYDINNPTLDRAPAEFDVPHFFKANATWELPFGNGRWLDPENGILERIVGGWEVAGLVNISSGTRFSILSNRGTLNRGGRSAGKNGANSSLTHDEIQDNIGIFRDENGNLYFINPAILNPERENGAPAGTSADGEAPFAGQVFSNPGPGQTGGLQRRGFVGPKIWTLDMSLIKRTAITERVNMQFRAEFFNLLNHPIFFVPEQNNINSVNFGRLTQALVDPRVVQLAVKFEF